MNEEEMARQSLWGVAGSRICESRLRGVSEERLQVRAYCAAECVARRVGMLCACAVLAWVS